MPGQRGHLWGQTDLPCVVLGRRCLPSAKLSLPTCEMGPILYPDGNRGEALMNLG